MKKWLYMFVAAAFVAGVLISIVVAQGGDTVLIENKYTKKLKEPVTLAHKKHAEDRKIACTECHHMWKQEAGTQPQKCATCHTEQGEEKKLGTKRAYHKQCMDCHKKLKTAGKPTGPTTKCNDCHPKKATK